ncbi:MAG: hypothetical protein ACKVVP_05785, partial [Chloroflexota bacterium]
ADRQNSLPASHWLAEALVAGFAAAGAVSFAAGAESFALGASFTAGAEVGAALGAASLGLAVGADDCGAQAPSASPATTSTGKSRD